MPEIKRTQQDVTVLQQPGLHRFSPGLYLQISGPHAKSWLYRYTIAGKARAMGLGSARDLTLAQARKLVEELRVNKVSKKIDPIAEKKSLATQKRTAEAQAVPFRERAEQYITAHEDGWRNRKHREQWRSTLQTYVYPFVGDKPATAITIADVVEILRPIWVVKRETARRVRGRIESVLDYAADADDPLYRNPAMLCPALIKKLPKIPKGKRKASHHPALPYEQIGAFMVELRSREGMAAKALDFTILTAKRTTEVLEARWDEIDTRLAIWTIPPERMKGNREHRVPLSPAALEILADVRRAHNGELVFPSLPFDGPLSDAAMLTVLQRMGRTDITVHGFRSTFRTWAEEETDFPHGVCEAALAHALKDETEAAYQRGDLLRKRGELMAAWASYCGGVVP